VVHALDADESEPGVWQAHIGNALTASGAVADEEILAAARRLLALAFRLTWAAGLSPVTGSDVGRPSRDLRGKLPRFLGRPAMADISSVTLRATGDQGELRRFRNDFYDCLSAWPDHHGLVGRLGVGERVGH
jgi:hypothetical protein